MTDRDPNLDRTIVADDGRILLMSCQQFVGDICQGGACFVCGAHPSAVEFNDEHIIPRWVLRRFGLFEKEITLPTGELRKYGGYRLPCCRQCNTLLGERVETPVSRLLAGDFGQVIGRLAEGRDRELLFTWICLLFLKTHLKDSQVRVHKDQRLGSEVIGDFYEWPTLHHIHAVARAPYTGANLMPGVVGSMQVFEVSDPGPDQYDYLAFSNDHTVVVQVGRIGIVAVLTDAGGAEIAWSEKLSVIEGPISSLQLREVGAMLAVANANLKSRPEFGTMYADGRWLFIFANTPRAVELEDFVPEQFGAALLFAVQSYVRAGVLEIDGTKDREAVATKIASGYVRFLTDANGNLRRHGAMNGSPG